MAMKMDFFFIEMLFVFILSLHMAACTNNCNNGKNDKISDESLQAKHAEEIWSLNREIISLKDRVKSLEAKSSKVEHGQKPDAGTKEGHPNPHLLNKRGLFRRRRYIPVVAFQAILTTQYATVYLHDAIVFNEVITDIGTAYNKHTGIFTTPFAGIYVFHTNIVSERGYYIEASIQVNYKATVSAISDHRVFSNRHYFDNWDQGSAAAVLALKKGDKVCVSVQWPQGSHDVHGVGKSSFSGYLLRLQKHN